MNTLQAALFIARRDLAVILWRRETVLWTFVMPILFFYFVGTVTGGFGSPTGYEDRPDPLAMRAPENAGFLLDELVGRLEEQNFRVDRPDTEEDWARYARRLTVTLEPAEAAAGTPSLTDWAVGGEPGSPQLRESPRGTERGVRSDQDPARRLHRAGRSGRRLSRDRHAERGRVRRACSDAPCAEPRRTLGRSA